jgi:hypothetical protein
MADAEYRTMGVQVSCRSHRTGTARDVPSDPSHRDRTDLDLFDRQRRPPVPRRTRNAVCARQHGHAFNNMAERLEERD